MPEYDDDTLEVIMREGLEFRAGSAATALADPPGPDRHAVRRGRGRWIAVAAAAAVVVAGGVTYAALHGSGSDDGQVAVDSGPVPSDWRYESYDGVQVRVPSDWGWGGAPTTTAGELMGCGTSEAAVLPGTEDAQPATGSPFVGRPAVMSDMCVRGDGDGTRPQGNAVWLGSSLPVGTDTSGAVTAQTVAVGSQHVTVFGADDALRTEILATAEAVDIDANGCPSAPVDTAAPGPTGHVSPQRLSVCVYDRDRLLWSTTKDAQQAQRYVTAFQQTSAGYDFAKACPPKPSDQWVAIGVDYAGAPKRWDIADFGCGSLLGSYSVASGDTSAMEAPLVPATVEPWAGGGIKAYVVGPVDLRGSDVASYFRGMLG